MCSPDYWSFFFFFLQSYCELLNCFTIIVKKYSYLRHGMRWLPVSPAAEEQHCGTDECVFTGHKQESLPSLCHLHKSLMSCGRPGLSGSSAHGSPDQSTAMFDRDAEKVPGGTREPSVTKSQWPRIKPLHSVNFLNGASHSRGVLAKQLLQRPESGNSTQCDSQLSATHSHNTSFTWR